MNRCSTFFWGNPLRTARKTLQEKVWVWMMTVPYCILQWFKMEDGHWFPPGHVWFQLQGALSTKILVKFQCEWCVCVDLAVKSQEILENVFKIEVTTSWLLFDNLVVSYHWGIHKSPWVSILSHGDPWLGSGWSTVFCIPAQPRESSCWRWSYSLIFHRFHIFDI